MPGRDEIEAVLFDWDGTLADSLAGFLAANEAVMRTLGVPFDAATYRRVYTPDWRVVYRRLGVADDRLDEANALWHEHFDLRSPGTPTLPGVPESLARLAAAGLRLGVVTAGDRSVVEPLIASTGLDDLLEVRVYVGDSPRIKPDPAPLRLALERLGMADRPGAAVYLGDAPDDMRMARAAGVHAVGVVSLLGEPAELLAAGGESIVGSVSEWVAGWLPPAPVRAIVLADGDRPDRAALDAAWPGWDAGVSLVVGADGGALAAESLGLRLDLVVGDGDSAGEPALARLAAAGVVIERSRVDKDETDTELAILAALTRGADDLTILGALGGARIDHALANVTLLAHPALAGRRAVLLDARARVRLVVAPDDAGRPVRVPLPGAVGDTVSLLPLAGEVGGLVTDGLRYSLRDEPLALGPARGLSNVRTDSDASIVVGRGRLLVVEVAPASLLRSTNEHA